jgi:hypothetical protein
VDPLLVLLTNNPPYNRYIRWRGFRWSRLEARHSAARALGALGPAAADAIPTLEAMAASDPFVLRAPRSVGNSLGRALAHEAFLALEAIRRAQTAEE